MKDGTERFWSKVDKIGPNDCWEWQAYKDINGYGQFWHNRKIKYAHRTAWELTNGPILNRLCVLHHCDNPGCVNPSHLFLGTRADNAIDRDKKGRLSPIRGERNGRAKLTEKEVRAIRDDPRSDRILGKIYRVDHTIIGDVRRRENWGWLK